ncbi:hypothetical protein ABGT15_07965 [Flavobacterium enshiense]|uniref:hypothetical protein n=1 Tax=Flavobacterium enshiense TaxID=1341165 RepID=UPI00345D77FE
MTSSSEFGNNLEQPNKTTSETGHAKNVANFLRLISYCHSLEEIYNPSNNRLKIAQLETLYHIALEKLNDVRTQKTNFDIHTNNRRKAFEDLKPFCTKITNAFAVSGVNKLILEDAKAVNKKIQGVVLKNTAETNYCSQQSYDRKIEHFANLTEILKQNTIYNPNEQELKIDSLQTKLDHLRTQNHNLINSYLLYSKALQERNQTLYNAESGLIQTAKEVKQYIKSVFGTNSSQYHQIRNIEFKVRTGE